jgi:hypothetical protein
MRKVNDMDWYIFLIIGYVAGFFSPILALIIYGRKQISKALKQVKVK